MNCLSTNNLWLDNIGFCFLQVYSVHILDQTGVPYSTLRLTGKILKRQPIKTKQNVKFSVTA